MKPIDKKKGSLRLQVFLSRQGICSRRAAMKLVQSGRVKINGATIVEPSTPVHPTSDKVTVDGRMVKERSLEYILLHKRAGYITTKEKRSKTANVYELLPKKFHHLASVGRLDKNTEGLLLFTNDGDAAYRLTHPKFNVDKVYDVTIEGNLSPKDKMRLMNGIIIEGKKTAKTKITGVSRKDNTTKFRITLHEGRKRQIRLMCDKVGHKVLYLKRIAQGPLQLKGLKFGSWRRLNQNEISQIKKIKAK